MNFVFQSSDFGALVLGREVLKNFPNAGIEFWVAQKEKQKELISEKTLWELALKSILESTRFGRIGFFYDRQNSRATEFFCKDRFQTCPYAYTPSDKRAEKKPQFYTFETQALHHLVNEGLADTVEFRRLARKFLRSAKHAHCDTVFFVESIFGEEKTRKILQHIAGTQMRVVVSSDFVLSLIDASSSSRLQNDDKRSIVIHTGDDLEFTKKRAEKILRTKLAKTNLKA